jgi:hypothetical protein
MREELFKFPTLKEGTSKVEREFVRLMSRRRQGDPLAPEELDYMDWANNALQDARGHRRNAA